MGVAPESKSAARGGRIAYYSSDDFGVAGEDQAESSLPGTNVTGGAGGTHATRPGEPGSDGTLYDGAAIPFTATGNVLTFY